MLGTGGDKMKYIRNCSHEIDEETIKFIEGKGFVGVCKKCGVKLERVIRHNVEPRQRQHMSKKERLKGRSD